MESAQTSTSQERQIPLKRWDWRRYLSVGLIIVAVAGLALAGYQALKFAPSNDGVGSTSVNIKLEVADQTNSNEALKNDLSSNDSASYGEANLLNLTKKNNEVLLPRVEGKINYQR